MTKLIFKNNTYYINKPKPFKSKQSFNPSTVKRVFDFAYSMSFGSKGEHRLYRSGGKINRKLGQVFSDTFQGKLAEFAVYKMFKKFDVKIEIPDLDVYKLGDWDSYDFFINGYTIAVKSTKHYGQLLLLETKDWNVKGEYIPNLTQTNKTSLFDYFILVRIKPSIEDLMKQNHILYNNNISDMKKDPYISLKNTLNINEISNMFRFDIPGVISNKTLKYIIKNQYILPQDSFLNTTKMDATNYYIQAGDMHSIEKLIKIVRGTIF